MIAPKGAVSNEMWKCISRGLDKIDAICNNATLLLDFQEDDFYKDVDIYDEIITWRALLHSSEMLNIHSSEGIVKNIFGESLSEDMKNLTSDSSEKKCKYFGN